MFAIAWITLRRVVERAVLVQFGILALVLIYVGLGLDTVILSDAAGSESSGLGVTWMFLTAFTIFWSTIEIPREVSRKEVHVYLAKPISRMRYVCGKYLGMAGMVMMGEGLLLGVFSVCLLIKGRPPGAVFYFGAARVALFLILLNAICVAASMALSEVPAMVTVLAVVFAASIVYALAVLAWSSFDPLSAFGLAVAYHAVPDLLHYRWEPIDGRWISYLGGLTVYTSGWTTLCLLFGWACFVRRDLP